MHSYFHKHSKWEQQEWNHQGIQRFVLNFSLNVAGRARDEHRGFFSTHQTLLYPIDFTERGSHTALTTSDRELVYVLEDKWSPVAGSNSRTPKSGSVTPPSFPWLNNNEMVEGDIRMKGVKCQIK